MRSVSYWASQTAVHLISKPREWYKPQQGDPAAGTRRLISASEREDRTYVRTLTTFDSVPS